MVDDSQAVPEGNKEHATPDGQGKADNSQAVTTDDLKAQEQIYTYDRIAIFAASTAFLLIFALSRPLHFPPLFQYLAFLIGTTLILVGFARATGIVKLDKLIVGGGVAVFVAMLWFTQDMYKEYYKDDVAGKEEQIAGLRAALDKMQHPSVVLRTLRSENSKPIPVQIFYASLGKEQDVVPPRPANSRSSFTFPIDDIDPKRGIITLSASTLDFHNATATDQRDFGPDTVFDVERLAISLNPPIGIDLYMKPR